MLQSIGISPCQLTCIYENFKEQYSEAQKAQEYCLNNSESDSHEKDDKQEKVNPLVRLHEAMQEKLKTGSYSERIPDKWSRMYCSEYINIFEYLV